MIEAILDQQTKTPLPHRRGPMVNVEELLNAIASFMEVTKEEILSPSRKLDLSVARLIAYTILRRENGYSLNKIGKILNRDHATVHNGIRKAIELFTFDTLIRYDIKYVCIQLNAYKTIAFLEEQSKLQTQPC